MNSYPLDLAKREESLGDLIYNEKRRNPRLTMFMRSLGRRGRGLQKIDRAVFEILRRLWGEGKAVGPEDLP